LSFAAGDGASAHGRVSESRERTARSRCPTGEESGAMYIIRETFTAKPGMASKLAKLFTEMISSNSMMSRTNIRVMTDYVGPFNTVVMETEVENLEEFGRQQKEYMEKSNVSEKMKNYTDLYLTGSREIYQVVNVPAGMRR
jgi:hypothetical protein